MTSTPAPSGLHCSECRAVNRMSAAQRTITSDKGQQWHLCWNHAAVVIHQNDIYDQVMNPKGKK